MTFLYAVLFGNILQALHVASWDESWTGDSTWFSIMHAFFETCFHVCLYLPGYQLCILRFDHPGNLNSTVLTYIRDVIESGDGVHIVQHSMSMI